MNMTPPSSQTPHTPFEDWLPGYVNGTLTNAQRHQVETHVETCAVCRQTLREWQLIGAAVRLNAQHTAFSLPPMQSIEAGRDTMTNIPALSTPPRPLQRPSQRRWTTFSIGFAAMLALVVIVFAQVQQTNTLYQQPSAQPITPAPTTAPLPVLVEVTPEATEELVWRPVASQFIEVGDVISEHDIVMQQWPIELAPRENVVRVVSNIVGSIARTNIACGQPFYYTHLAGNARNIVQYVPTYNEPYCFAAEMNPQLTEIAVTNVVVIGSQGVQQGSLIDEADIELRAYPSQFVPMSAILDINEVVGKVATYDLLRDQIVMRDMLVQRVRQSEQPLTVEGLVLVEVPFELFTDNLYGLQSGDRVDVVSGIYYRLEGGQRGRYNFIPGNGVPDVMLRSGFQFNTRMISEAMFVSVGRAEDGGDIVILALNETDATFLHTLIEYETQLSLTLLPE